MRFNKSEDRLSIYYDANAENIQKTYGDVSPSYHGSSDVILAGLLKRSDSSYFENVKLLGTGRDNLAAHVEKGTMPIFGHPVLCFNKGSDALRMTEI